MRPDGAGYFHLRGRKEWINASFSCGIISHICDRHNNGFKTLSLSWLRSLACRLQLLINYFKPLLPLISNLSWSGRSRGHGVGTRLSTWTVWWGTSCVSKAHVTNAYKGLRRIINIDVTSTKNQHVLVNSRKLRSWVRSELQYNTRVSCLTDLKRQFTADTNPLWQI